MLGSMLRDNSVIDDVIHIIHKDDFYADVIPANHHPAAKLVGDLFRSRSA